MDKISQIFSESFDLTDRYTCHYLATINEAEQADVLSALSSALYDKIVKKVDKIDFGTIPKSRGDITKVDGYEKTLECIDIIQRLFREYKVDTEIPDSINTAITNIRDRKSMFMKAYGLKIEMPMVMYNLIVLSIERSVAFTISTCLEYVKTPNSTLKMAVDKVAVTKAEDDLMLKQLTSFNVMCANGSFDKTMTAVMKTAGKIAHEAFAYNEDGEPVDENGIAITISFCGLKNDGEAPVKTPAFILKHDNEPFKTEDPFGDTPVDTQIPDGTPEEDAPIDNTETLAPAAQYADEFGPDGEFDGIDDDTIDDDEDDDFGLGRQDVTGKYDDYLDDDDEEDTINDLLLGGIEDDGVEPQNIPHTTSPDSTMLPDYAGAEDQDGLDDQPVNEDWRSVAFSTASDILGKMAGEQNSNNNDDGKDKPKMKTYKKIIIGAGLALGALALLKDGIIPFCRYLCYFFAHTKAKASDYLLVQAQLIEANANELEVNSDTGLSEEKKKKVVAKQRKIADKLRSLGQKLSIDGKQAQAKAKKDAETDEKEKKKIAKDDDGDDGIF